MKKDNEKIKQLIQLSEENPELEIKVMVHSDVVPDDCYMYWSSSIGNIEKTWVWERDESTVIDESNIYDELSDDLSDNPDYDNLSDDDFKKIVKETIECKKQNKEIVEAIIIFVETP